MAAFYLIATLMVFQGLLFSCCETTVTSTPTVTASNTLPTTVQATPSVTTTAAGGGGISPSKTTTTITSSVAPEKEPGPTVIVKLAIKIVGFVVNLLDLKISVQNDIEIAYKSEGFQIKYAMTLKISFNSPINITLELSFYSGIPSGKTIKGVLQAALKEGKITNLTESNTNYTVTFTGVTLKYNPKAGQCKAICCDGAGGPLTVERVCTPEDKCEGIEPDEKEEDGHCSKEEKGTCPDTCGDDGSGGIHNSPSYALLTLLAIAIFTKTMFF